MKVTFKINLKVVIAVLLGLIMGYGMTKFFFPDFFGRSFLAIIPWGIVGIATCWLASTAKESRLLGVTYMVVLTVSFLLAGNLKFNEDFLPVMLLILATAVISALCGILMGWVVFKVKTLISKRNKSSI